MDKDDSTKITITNTTTTETSTTKTTTTKKSSTKTATQKTKGGNERRRKNLVFFPIGALHISKGLGVACGIFFYFEIFLLLLLFKMQKIIKTTETKTSLEICQYMQYVL